MILRDTPHVPESVTEEQVTEALHALGLGPHLVTEVLITEEQVIVYHAAITEDGTYLARNGAAVCVSTPITISKEN